ncbi:MAG TPA: ATP-binding protein [Saprospiraceae bacterium]|nr:ATP-binding protein [Saprospiraceae bacterium]
MPSALIIAQKELAFLKEEKGKRAVELVIANKKLVFQDEEKRKCTSELILANRELKFQNEENEKRAAELVIANTELIFQNQEKGKRAAELILANNELSFQYAEKEKREAELILVNRELKFQNEEKEIRAAEYRKFNQDKEIVLNRISDGVVSIDNDWRYTFLNQASMKYHPVDPLEAVGKVMWEIYPELVGSLLWEKFHEAMHTKKVVKFEAFDPLLNIWFELKVYPSWDGLTIIYKDVTESKQAEQELLQTLKEVSDYKFALDEASIVDITDQKGIIKYVNDNFCKISKFNKEEIIGQEHSIINSGYHRKEFIHDLWATIAQGKTWRGELKNKAKDGTFYWVDTTIVPLLNEAGKPLTYLAISADVTQRKQAEDRILKMNEELEDKVTARTLELTQLLENEKEINEMKSRFVSLASHEFRTPLSTILSSVSLIGCYNEENQVEKRSKHIHRIKSSIADLTGILNDFLSLDKLEHGKTEMNPEAFDFYEFSLDIIDEVSLMLKLGQEINFNMTGDRQLFQDKKILKNVFLNLISNASKYSAEGQKIFLNIEVFNYRVIIHVKDEGIGIPEEEQRFLFQKFFRAKNAIAIQGTGLGLTIVKKYVELLGGTIEFSSKLNRGSTFIVEIPQKMI